MQLNEDNHFKSEVAISIGILTDVVDGSGNHTVTIKAPGHDYTFDETDAVSHNWGIKAPTVRPMWIGTSVSLLELCGPQEEYPVPSGAPSCADGEAAYYEAGGRQYYVIGSEVYTVVPQAEEADVSNLTAYNYRRSRLYVYKQIEGEAPEDSLYEYTFTAANPDESDVWFSLWDNSVDAVVKDAEVSGTGVQKELDANGEFTGYYYYPGGTEVTVKVKKDWSLGFTNVPVGFTYEISETDDGDGDETAYNFIEITGQIGHKESAEDEEFIYEDIVEAEAATIDGNTISGEIIDNNQQYEIYIKNEYALRNITVIKIWDDADDNDGLRPDELAIQLSAGDEAYGDPVTLTEANADPDDPNKWVYVFENLPAKDADGEPIEYSADETEVPDGYTKTGPTANDDGSEITITNSHTPETIKVVVVKEWDDAENQDGKRPDSVSVQLYAGTEAIGNPIELNEDNDWTATVGELPKYADGEEIEYSWEEDETGLPEGYSMTGNETVENVTTITNSYEPEKTEATVKKIWDDADNQDGKRPAELKVTLSNGTEVTLNEENEWTATVTDLPKYADGVEIEYTWTEGELPEGYELTDTSVDGTVTTLTNSYEPEKTEATVKKVWDDAENQDGKRPAELKVTLSDGTEVTLNEDNNWEATVTDLPKYADGREITYTWEEDEDSLPEGYTLTSTSVKGTVTTLTNSYEPEKTEATVKKVWDDAENQDGKRPAELKVTLSNGTEVTLNEENEWTATVTDLPKYADGVEIEYTWTEGELPEGYELTDTSVDGTVTTLTNSYEPEKTEATVKKIWNDADNQDGKRPAELKVTLSNGTEVTLNEENGWIATVTDLPKYADGVEIEYTWTEGELPEGYELTNTSVDGTVTTLTNSYEPEKTEATVKKVWDDADNQDGIRPAELKVTLSNGTEVTLNEENGWEATVTDLPKYADGVEIEYTWTEGELPEGYELTDTSVDGTVTTLTNSHEPEVIEIPIEKVWKGDEDYDVRPESITVVLLDGEEEIAELTLNEDNGWKGSFKDLDANREGEPIEYDIKEVEVKAGYKSTVSGSAEEGFVITNEFTPKYIDPPVKKEVKGNGEVGDDKFTFQLKALNGAPMPEGVTGDTMTIETGVGEAEFGNITIVEEGTYEYEISEVPDDGNEKYKYDDKVYHLKFVVSKGENGELVDEAFVDGESVGTFEDIKASTFTFTNEVIEYIEIDVEKVWDDEATGPDKRPDSITVDLYANGEHIDAVELSEDNSWKYTFTNLRKSDDDGNDIEYTISEVKVEAYETKITGSAEEGFVITNTRTVDTGDASKLDFWRNLYITSTVGSLLLAALYFKKEEEK